MPPFPTVPFTMATARELGLTRQQVRSAVVDGRLRRVFREVYVDTRRELTSTDRARALALVTPPHLVVCDRTAAWQHGVDPWRFFELDVEPRLELCALRGREPSERPEVRCLTRDLRRDDVVALDGVRVTTPLRTALDLGCRLPRRDAFAAMNALAAAHHLDRDQLLGQLPRYRGRRGAVQLKQLAPLLEPRVESWRESWVLIDIVDHGLPVPEAQHWVTVDGRRVFRLDFAYPHARVAVEHDGEEHHTSEADRRADQERREWLRQRGWRVIVVTRASFDHVAVPEWILELRTALRLSA
jgi:hypothetical protein